MAGETRPARGKSTKVTWVGLFIALFGIVLIRDGIRLLVPTASVRTNELREALILATAVLLLFLVRRWEGLPFKSIGIGTSVWWKSVLWGLVTMVLCGGAAVVLAKATGYGGGPAAEAFARLPLWLITVTVVRAGIVEELFYRGYAIERLQGLGMNRYVAAGIPLVIFAGAHYTAGWANILIAFALGLVLAAFYLWRRDLVANMLAHTLVDFVANVLPRLFS